MKNSKIIHIVVIIVGIIFIAIPAFHSNMWFDESYSVAISNHNFGEIWTIGGNDVHPVLYYWILHIINILFGSNILLYRLFSVMCIALLGILGYTHIRKEFGEKTGILFSMFVYLFPVNLIYAGEIRMYSFAMLLVTLMSIYAYRIWKNKDEKNIKNWSLFAIFSLASAYTHYYGLMIAGIENVFLFIMFTIQAIREKKFTYNLKVFFISAIPQILLYLPWVMTLFRQMDGVSKGFWISLQFPDSYIQLFTFPFVGNLDVIYVAIPIAITVSLFIYLYAIFLHVKNFVDKKKNNDYIVDLKFALFAFGFWLMVIFGAWLVSKLMSRTILYARYLLCAEGLLIFFLSCTFARKGYKIINTIVCIITIALSIFVGYELIQENYGKVDNEFNSYISENIKERDIIICQNEGSGFVVSAHYPNNKLYFYDVNNWNVGPAYKAYGETVYDLNFLNDYKGRIWLINTTHYGLYEEVNKKFDVKLIDQKSFSVEYKKYQYSLTLVEK